jgi:hypothetical protein
LFLITKGLWFALFERVTDLSRLGRGGGGGGRDRLVGFSHGGHVVIVVVGSGRRKN